MPKRASSFTRFSRNNAQGSAVIGLLLAIVMLGAGVWVAVNRQTVIDWWRLTTYTPSAAAKQLADATAMAGRGRDLFYVSDPKIEGSAQFNQNCSDAGEQTIVLGCYAHQNIYVYDVTNAQLSGVKEVTSAHEMLHAAYERLDNATKNRVNAMLQAAMPKVEDDHLRQLINAYSKSEPGELNNEMHSILGTEYGNLPPGLEQYYTRYFADRSKVVAYAQAYKKVFTDSQGRIAQDDTVLAGLKNQIDANIAQLDALKNQIDQKARQLEQLQASDPKAYNQAVPGYNAQAREYNALAASTHNLISQYNTLVDTRNAEAATQNNLYQSLSSQYQPVPAQ